MLINDVYDYLKKNCGFKPGIDNKTNPRMILEHAIPWDVFFFYLVKQNFSSSEDLFDYLKRTFCLCRITSDENKKLDAAGLKSKMPDEWNNWDDRYRHVGIKLSQKPVNPANPSLNITKSNL